MALGLILFAATFVAAPASASCGDRGGSGYRALHDGKCVGIPPQRSATESRFPKRLRIATEASVLDLIGRTGPFLRPDGKGANFVPDQFPNVRAWR
jgi:hypothetical protein